MTLKELLRSDFANYVRPHFEKQVCECCGSDTERLHVHHVTHFQDLLDETLKILQLEYHDDTDMYSDNELQLIREVMLGKQMTIQYVTCCEPCHLELHDGCYYKQNKSITRPKKRGERITIQGRPVICIETGNVYPSMSVAERQTEIDGSSISKCCQGKRQYAGKHPITNEKLHWMYYEKWLAMTNLDREDETNE